MKSLAGLEIKSNGMIVAKIDNHKRTSQINANKYCCRLKKISGHIKLNTS